MALKRSMEWGFRIVINEEIIGDVSNVKYLGCEI
jgi:hypothetical protein